MASQLQPLPHDDYGPQLNALSAVLVVLSGAFLFLRLTLKLYQRRGLWWDDYILTLAWLTLVVVAVLTYLTTRLGFGKHVWDLDPADVPQIVTLGSVAGTLTIFGSAWSKTSFALTLLRLPIGGWRYFVWFIVISVNLLLYTTAASLWFECKPPPPPLIPGMAPAPKMGQDSQQQGACLPVELTLWYGIFAGGFSGLMDLALAALPWKFLWSLRMEKTEKAGVLIAMSMGVFAGMSAIIKTTKLPLVQSTDISADGVQLSSWGMVEIAVTIMAASIPILRALIGQSRSIMPLGSSVDANGVPVPRRTPSARRRNHDLDDDIEDLKTWSDEKY